MAKVLVSDQYLQNIANAIRTLNGQSSTSYTPALMAPAINAVSFVNYYTGISTPASNLGSNGDIYFQTESV